MLSAYGRGGAQSADKIGVGVAAKCQDCHIRNVSGPACNKQGVKVRSDLALHDLTGGNSWMLGILASADAAGPAYDAYNYSILSGAKYAGASIDVAGLQGFGAALLDGRLRALQQLKMAADLVVVADDAQSVTIRVVNNSGHKLLSGYPEGRRLWLNVVFMDTAGVLAEINPYSSLVTTTDAAGNAQYVSGGELLKTHEESVWEANMTSALSGEPETFHFVLATDRHKDNRIPPRGFDWAAAASRMTTPRWEGADALDYFTTKEYEGGYDEVTIPKPAGTVRFSATLYYQTTSKEYVGFLRNEVRGIDGTLEASAYIAQSDP